MAEGHAPQEEQPNMFRVYVGNLNTEVDEGMLRGLFEEHGIAAGNILVKRKYAFVDCPDQESVDRAIDSLNGTNFMGSNMQVEPSMARKRKSNRIQVRNLPINMSRDDVEDFMSNYGKVEKVEQAGAEGLVYITFSNPDEAQQALSNIKNTDFRGQTLQADFAGYRKRNPREANNNTSGMHRVEMPLRILVGSEYVGAIIGRQGQTIHNITSTTRARIDIHRRDSQAMSSSGAPETLVTIKGSPESCTDACKEVMKVVQQEAKKHNKDESPLKILCPNHLCGRIIGKQGNVIKGFMEQSGTHMVVSSVADPSNLHIDRVVTVTGQPENVGKAEGLLSEKMRKCYEQDSQNYMQQMSMFGGMPPMGIVPNFGGYQSQGMRPPFQQHYSMEGFYSGMYGGGRAPPPEIEVTSLYVPENAVGSIIGSKGANIKEINNTSGAKVRIIGQREANGEGSQQNKMQERRAVITGGPEAQFQAHFQIFEKIKNEGGFARMDDVHLRSEILVPKSMIGRIIGKKGQNVKELQRVSGGIVKLPELDNQNASDDSEVAVSIIGNYHSMIAAQRRIRQLVSSASMQPPNKPRSNPRGENGHSQ